MPPTLARGPDGSAVRPVGMWEPCTYALDRAPTALDAAPVQGSGFIAEHAGDADAREGEIVGNAEDDLDAAAASVPPSLPMLWNYCWTYLLLACHAAARAV